MEAEHVVPGNNADRNVHEERVLVGRHGGSDLEAPRDGVQVLV